MIPGLELEFECLLVIILLPEGLSCLAPLILAFLIFSNLHELAFVLFGPYWYPLFNHTCISIHFFIQLRKEVTVFLLASHNQEFDCLALPPFLFALIGHHLGCMRRGAQVAQDVFRLFRVVQVIQIDSDHVFVVMCFFESCFCVGEFSLFFFCGCKFDK